MSFFKIANWLMGYIVFISFGGFPERFVNLCAVEGIPVRDIKMCKGKLTGKTSIAGYKRMRKIAEKSGMKLRIKSKCGLPFICRRHKKRIGVVIGAAIFILVPFFLSHMIWSIDVVGNTVYTEEEIIAIAEQSGLKIGMSVSRLNIQKIESSILSKAENIMWLSLNQKGSAVEIVMREKVLMPDISPDSSPCNIVAEKDGQIADCEAYTGEAQVKIGNAVSKGDLLISGTRENNDTSVDLLHASGYVTAYTSDTISEKIPKNLPVKKIENIKCRYTLYVLGMEIPLFIKRDMGAGEYYQNSWRLVVSEKTIPVGFKREQYIYYSPQTVSVSSAQATMLTKCRLLSKISDSLTGARILGCDIRKSAGNEITANLKLLENIGMPKNFEVINTDISENP